MHQKRIWLKEEEEKTSGVNSEGQLTQEIGDDDNDENNDDGNDDNNVGDDDNDDGDNDNNDGD